MSALHYTSIAAAKASEPVSLSALFRKACVEHAQRPAVTCGDRSLTYAELETVADRIAAGLLERGVRPGCIVALYLDRSTEMIAAMLGVIKVGAAYLPLDTSYPAQRIAEIITDASPSAVIGLAASSLSGLPHTALYLRIEDLLETQRPCIDMPATGDDAAYVIYTSGSTGQPKGVVVSHNNVARLLSATKVWFDFNEDDVWTMFHSFAFDFSVWEIWGALLNGARLVIVPFAVSRAPEQFLALLARERVTVLNQTPSAFALLTAEDERNPTTGLALRYVIFGGEALNPGLLQGWFSRHDENAPEMINMYGITETTVHVTYRRMRAADALTEHESLIGEPIPDLQLHLLDDNLQPVTDGVEGELYIGGAGVSLGYLNRPALTAQRFLRDPGRSSRSARLYRSGDLARRRRDGELVFLGRRDGQVKINGFRIETGEIEAALLGCPGIRQACVVALAEEDRTPARLAAYFIAERLIATAELRTLLAARLPRHMLPAFYEQLTAFPLNANGKIDRAALPAPQAGGRPANAIALEATELEQLIAETWAKVLRAGSVSLDANFFDIGGTSMSLIAARGALERELHRSIPVTVLFEHTTVRALARHLNATNSAAAPDPGQAEASVEVNPLETNVRKQRAAFARARANRSIA